MISAEIEAQILRYFHAERWKVGTIAHQLQIHHSVITRVLSKAFLVQASPRQRARLIDPYVPFITETLKQFPRLTATRLYLMVRERGYRGSVSHFRDTVKRYRPARKSEAYLRLRTLPGEQAQCDWAVFEPLQIGAARRPLLAFVMVLSYSRALYLRFFLNARMENFLRGHLGAFAAWGGVPRVILYDNLKSAVLERQGTAIRFNPTLLQFAGHYRFEPRPVAVCRGNEKGRVERAIRFVRDSFWPARTFQDLDDLNAQAAAWCAGPAADRPCPEEPARRVQDVFLRDDQPHLMSLPDAPYPVIERAEVRVGKTPYVRFDLNDYSVPHEQVGKTLTVLADPHEVRIVDGARLLARHPRSYDKGAQIETAAHLDALAREKHAARTHRDHDRLTRAVPISQALLVQAADRGEILGRISAELLLLLEHYGAAELEAAIKDALERGVPHPNAVRLALERRREAQQKPPPVALPRHIQARDVVVRRPRLDTYDQLRRDEQGDDHDH